MGNFTEVRERARRSWATKPGLCQWFLKCRNRATTTQDHPILGKVPICARCKKWYKSMGNPKSRRNVMEVTETPGQKYPWGQGDPVKKAKVRGVLTYVDASVFKIDNDTFRMVDPRYWSAGSSQRASRALYSLTKLVGKRVVADADYHRAFGWTVFGRRAIKLEGGAVSNPKRKRKLKKRKVAKRRVRRNAPNLHTSRHAASTWKAGEAAHKFLSHMDGRNLSLFRDVSMWDFMMGSQNATTARKACSGTVLDRYNEFIIVVNRLWPQIQKKDISKVPLRIAAGGWGMMEQMRSDF